MGIGTLEPLEARRLGRVSHNVRLAASRLGITTYETRLYDLERVVAD